MSTRTFTVEIDEYDLHEWAEDQGLVHRDTLGEDSLWDLTEKFRFDLVRSRDIEYAHDTQRHTGAVMWCREGACGVTYNY